MPRLFYIGFLAIFLLTSSNILNAAIVPIFNEDIEPTDNRTAEDTYDEDIKKELAIKNKNNIYKYFKPAVITGSVGPVWQANGETQTIMTEPNVIKTYKADNNTSTIGQVSIFAGFQKELIKKFTMQLGAALENASSATLSGDIWDDGDPEFNNYRYTYNIKATRIVAKGKLLYEKLYSLNPWVSASIGISYNQAHNFLNYPKIFPAIKNFNFKGYTRQAFTYGFGLGLQKNISKTLQIGAGYEFVDWGSSRLSKAPRQQTFNTINMNNYVTNGLLFNITYISED